MEQLGNGTASPCIAVRGRSSLTARAQFVLDNRKLPSLYVRAGSPRAADFVATLLRQGEHKRDKGRWLLGQD